MIDGYFIFWLVLALAGYAASGLFSGLETGIYSLSRVRLHLQARERRSAAEQLEGLIADPARLLATLLIGNNIANNLASSATSILLESSGLVDWQVIVVSVLVVTPLLFIFAETLPKDLFASHADQFVYPFSNLLAALRRLFTWLGLLPLIAWVSDNMMRLLGALPQPVVFHPRYQVQILVREGVGEGLLSDEQSAIVERVLKLAGRTVADEMVPWREVQTINENDPPAMLWELADKTSRSRFPVVASGGNDPSQPAKVVGVVSLYDALIYEQPTCPPIAKLMQSPNIVPASMPLDEALTWMKRSSFALGIVTDEGGAPLGVVSIKDLIEPITGELASW